MDFLNAVVFDAWANAVTWAELIGFVTGGACVWLTVRRHVANFPIGIANSLLFLLLFADARLWAVAGLQVMFLVLGVAGWGQWLRGKQQEGDVRVRVSSAVELAACVGAVVVGTAVLTVVLTAADDSAPFWDALTAALSLVAQWLLNARRLQNWFFWIAADILYIPLAWHNGLALTAVVYVLFLGMCLAGLRSWQQARKDVVVPQAVRG